MSEPAPTITCPCCGHVTFHRDDGVEDCSVCAWDYDIVQLEFVAEEGCANSVSLFEAQKNFMLMGVSDPARNSRAKPQECRRDRDGPRPGPNRDA
jgi:hypothetical protein